MYSFTYDTCAQQFAPPSIRRWSWEVSIYILVLVSSLHVLILPFFVSSLSLVYLTTLLSFHCVILFQPSCPPHSNTHFSIVFLSVIPYMSLVLCIQTINQDFFPSAEFNILYLICFIYIFFALTIYSYWSNSFCGFCCVGVLCGFFFFLLLSKFHTTETENGKATFI